ncbi:hypothetical protein C1646_787727 [Rhizophagus diaphanus]|nr:hypothetical protein C1646_787727 [Rhizophagus diaphanus] [Rhizophagus sp. MUCL 43196]
MPSTASNEKYRLINEKIKCLFLRAQFPPGFVFEKLLYLSDLWIFKGDFMVRINTNRNSFFLYKSMTSSSQEKEGTTLPFQENLLKKKLLKFAIKTKRMMSELGIIAFNITEKEIIMENNKLETLKVILSSNDDVVEEKENDNVSKDDNTSLKLSINMDNKK